MRAAMGLAVHLEGGHYRKIWRHRPADGGRSAGLRLWQAGAALQSRLHDGTSSPVRLGPRLVAARLHCGCTLAQTLLV